MEKQYIGCDAHRRYSVFVVMDEKGHASQPVRIAHERSELREYLHRPPDVARWRFALGPKTQNSRLYWLFSGWN